MISHSFEARIVNGQVVPGEALMAFEGQQVRLTVSAMPSLAPACLSVDADEVPESPEDLDVEKDVYVPMPFHREVLPNTTITTETALQPCLILPEDLPDE